MVRPLTNSDLTSLYNLRKYKTGDIERRLERGDSCFIAEINRQIGSSIWISQHEPFIPELESRFFMNSHSAYSYDEYTAPKYRGAGLLPILFSTVSLFLFHNGIDEIYTLVSTNNFSSLHAHQKVGSSVLGQVIMVKFFHYKIYLCKGANIKNYVQIRKLIGR